MKDRLGLWSMALLAAAILGTKAPPAAAAPVLSLDPQDWSVYSASSPYNGPLEPGGATIESTPSGLTFHARGYRQGTFLLSAGAYDLRDTTIYYQWMPDGAARYMSPSVGAGWWDGAMWTVANRPFSVNGSWGGMTRLYDDTWYYSRLTITPEKLFRCVTATQDYDDLGGTVVDDSGWTSVRTYPSDVWDHAAGANVYAYLWDNYSTAANVTLGEVRMLSTPEPASVLIWTLLGLAAIAFKWRSRRRSRGALVPTSASG